MELDYVLKPYSEIACHFDKTRSYLWKAITLFIESKEDTAFLLDAGCGNGKNIMIKSKRNCIGFDFCNSNNQICYAKGLEVSSINLKQLSLL